MCVLPLEDASSQGNHSFTLGDVTGEVPPDGTTTASTVTFLGVLLLLLLLSHLAAATLRST